MRRAKLNSFERSLRKFQALTQFCFNVLAFFVLASISTRKAQTTEIPFHVRKSRNILRIPVRLLFFFSRKIAHSIFAFPLICGRGLNVNTRTIRGEYKSKHAMDWRCAETFAFQQFASSSKPGHDAMGGLSFFVLYSVTLL